MSSVREVSAGIGASGVLRSGVVAMLDLISSANAKGVGAVFERDDKTPREHYSQVLHDEGLEPMWETFFCSLFTKASKILTPRVPEQISMIPGKLIGAAWHWAITSHQATNTENINGNERKNGNGGDNLFSAFYNAIIKGPSEFALKLCGLKGRNANFIWYGISQLGIFGLGSLALRNAEENLPGVNIDSDESFLKSLSKGIGYTIVEQLTYVASQGIRYYTDFKKEFKNNVAAKSLANVIHERFFPGHIFSGITAALSTYCFGKYIPKTTAAAIGEFPMMALNRVVNCNKRRATKYKVEQDVDPKTSKVSYWYPTKNKTEMWNYRFNASETFNSFLAFCDRMFDKSKDTLIKLVSKVFRVDIKELKDSFTRNLERRELVCNS